MKKFDLTYAQKNYLAVDFFLSMSCNKDCHYCTSYTLEMRNLTVDLDFLRYTLESLKEYKVRICLLGGEPGLIKNLREVIAMVKEYPNFIPQVLSNSFIRKRYPEVLEDPEILYVEHLTLDFYPDKIKKLGNYDYLEPNDMNNYNVVLKTPNYFKYIKNYPEFKKQLEHKNTMFKAFNGRTPTKGDVEEVHKQAAEIDRKMCAAFPMVPVIDFEQKTIVHCSKKFANNLELSRSFPMTKENIDKMMNFQLFKYEKYCVTCKEYVQPKGHFPIEKYSNILKV